LSRLRLSRNDGLLLLMTVIWGANYSIVKAALREIAPLAFNSLRLGLASLLFLVTIAVCRRRSESPVRPSDVRTFGPSDLDIRDATPDAPPHALPVFQRSPIAARDWFLIAVFGLVGHFIYQLCFLFGLDNTTVANSSLILGCSPVVVALLSAALGHEQVRPLHWVGAVLSVAGIYIVVGRAARLGGATLTGDVLTIGGLLCWGIYTVGVRGLLDRHSPLEVTGYSMAIGTVPYVLLGLGQLRTLDWQAVHAVAWAALVFSAFFALFVAYLIWYVAVQRIGNIRTAMYSNLTPIAALVIAAVWLDEHLTRMEIAGAVAILAGMAITRLVRPAPARNVAPAEE
jgi:drug/metabolite transporter (DMT)-like permease